MASQNFVSFILMPTIIDSPGDYITRGGEVVQVMEVSSRHDFKCRGEYSNGIPEGWHKTGRIYFGQFSDNDIIKKV